MRARKHRLALGAAALLLVAAAASTLSACSAGSAASSSSSTAQSPGASGFDGAALPAGVLAPDFTLPDEGGHPVSLAAYRGRVVIVAFVYSTCGAPCILIAQQIRGALDELDELGEPVPVLLVSADPAGDTPASVRRFLDRASLRGRARYLIGATAQLRPLLRAFRVISPARIALPSSVRLASS